MQEIPGEPLEATLMRPMSRRARSKDSYVAAGNSTTSGVFTDLASAGPAVTVTIGASGRALVLVSAEISNDTAGGFSIMGYAVTGATSLAASDERAAYTRSAVASDGSMCANSRVVTGLTPGANTFTSKYRQQSGGTGFFSRRSITVIPL